MHLRSFTGTFSWESTEIERCVYLETQCGYTGTIMSSHKVWGLYISTLCIIQSQGYCSVIWTSYAACREDHTKPYCACGWHIQAWPAYGTAYTGTVYDYITCVLWLVLWDTKHRNYTVKKELFTYADNLGRME